MKRTVLAVGLLGLCALPVLDASAKVKVINAGPRAVQTAPAAKTADVPAGETWIATKAILRDAKTGQLRKPTAAETRELVRTLRELTARPTDGPRRIISPNGKASAEMSAASPQVLVARATAEGQNETLCVQTFEEAANFLGLELAGGEK